MPMLTLTQKISRPSDLKVSHGNLKPASQVCKFPDRLQTFLRNFLEHLIFFVH